MNSYLLVVAFTILYRLGAFMHPTLGWLTPVAAAFMVVRTRRDWLLGSGAYILTDILLNGLGYHVGFSFFNWVPLACFSLMVMRPHVKLLNGVLTNALGFYFLTNSMAFLDSPEYPFTLAGWVQCLTVGTPGYVPTYYFLISQAVSMIIFVPLFQILTNERPTFRGCQTAGQVSH
jgi:hypothetical protein